MLSLKGKRIAVAGAGLGGLAAAARLRRAGAEVVVFEKNDRPGGKAAEWRQAGFRWDMGPSLLTMPDIITELFRDLGREVGDEIDLHRIEPVCRYFWKDGRVLDEDGEFFRRPDVAAFLEHARGIYELSGDAFLNHPPEEIWRAFTLSNLPKLRHLPKITHFRTVQEEVERYFQDPHLRQLFGRFATYNGSSPYRAPGTFNVIPYVEAAFGAWYVGGGMARLADALHRAAAADGVEFRFGCPVERIDADGLHPAGGPVEVFDAWVVNGDVIRAHQEWIRLPRWESVRDRLEREERSLSGLVVLLGVSRRREQLSHHNIFFSRDYRAEFDDLFGRRELPADPTIYVSITSRTDPGDAPPLQDNYFVLINAPSEIETIDWEARREELGEWVVRELEVRGLTGLGSDVVCRKVFTPLDFARRDRSSHGALYGWASHRIATSFFRPPLRSPLDPRLHFVGGTTHPGGGIPLVLLSARMTVEKIIRRFGIPL
jgi:phytoene desaturase